MESVKEQLITTLVMNPNNCISIEHIENNLEALQKKVSGFIETYDIGYLFPQLEGVRIILNEEGKLLGLPPTGMIDTILLDGTPHRELFVGTLLFCRTTEEGNFASLQDGDEAKIRQTVFRIIQTAEHEYTRIKDL